MQSEVIEYFVKRKEIMSTIAHRLNIIDSYDRKVFLLSRVHEFHLLSMCENNHKLNFTVVNS